MGGPIVRTGTTPAFWSNWEKAFGKSSGGGKTGGFQNGRGEEAREKRQGETRREGQEEKEVTGRRLVLAAVIGMGFAAFAEWRFPVPSVNEPHYLCKAKHFSDPTWCARDLFLASADAHVAFYAVFGRAARLFSFAQMAWIGRLLMLGAIAASWVRLVGRIVPGKWPAIGSTCVFLALQATGNLSGEWLIGGLEAKGFSYAALLWAIVAACDGRWGIAGIAAGVAISIHPVIGVWGLVALIAAWLTTRISRPGQGVPDEIAGLTQRSHSWLACVIPFCVVHLVVSSGLIPALAMLANRPSADEARRADEIQVFYRLPHHLDPAKFSKIAATAYAAMLIGWLLMRRLTSANAAERFFARFVLATAAIAGGGLVVGLWLRSPGLMKFYPFRLFDLFLPMAVSITTACLIERALHAVSERPTAGGRIPWNALGRGMAVVALAWGVIAPGRVENASRWPHEDWVEFVDACRWIEANTPRDALYLTPMYNVGFKWYAQRAEYVTWKDCPQDAANLLQWKERVDLLKSWGAPSPNGFRKEAWTNLSKRRAPTTCWR